jgi:hypothetical protein
MAAHARLSPSGSKKWFACAGSITLEAAFPNKSSEHSDRGTACHEIGARCLQNNDEAILHVGEMVEVEPERMVYQLWVTVDGTTKWMREVCDTEEQAKLLAPSCNGPTDIVPFVQPARFREFTEEMAEATQGYVDTVRALAEGHLLFIEQRVAFGDDIGVADQFGTADTTIMYVEQKELFVIDAKFGHTPVRVERNSQLLLYALGKYRELEMAYDIERVRIGIYQPEVWDTLQEYSCSVQELIDFAELANAKAQRVVRAEEAYAQITCQEELVEWEAMYLNPSPNDEECAFCRAMPTCSAVRRQLEETCGAAFDSIEENEHVLTRPEMMYGDKLAQEMRMAGLFEDRMKAVRAEVESRLLRGIQVPGFGLATGRAGARKFKNEQAAEKLLKETFRLKDDIIYNKKLKSPTQLEALAKVKRAKKGEPPPEPPIIGNARWQKVVMMVEQKPPGPTVKRIEDITNPWSPTAPSDDAFGVVAEEPAADPFDCDLI